MGKNRRKGKRKNSSGFLDWLSFLLTAIIIVSFFLPWVQIKLSKELGNWKFKTGSTEVNRSISGYEIPKVTPLFIPFDEAFTGVSDIGRWSSLVFLIPIVGIACFLLLLIGRRYKWADTLVILFGTGIFGVGLYEVYQASINSLLVDVVIGAGLWLTLISFLVFGIIGAVKLFI